MKPALELKAIKKSYFGNDVLHGVDLSVMPGEVHALVGENGAGKSTLMNILFGMPVIRETGGYGGTINLSGTKVSPESPSDAMNHGVGMVHQEFMLLPGFTVAENIRLNREITKNSLVSAVAEKVWPGGKELRSLDEAAMRERSDAALERTGISLESDRMVSGLPVGHMQFLEIAREVDKDNAKVIVFDEPTAVLTESEADQLLTAIERLAADGIAILFISHRLDEVLRVADKVTVLRDGGVVRVLDKAEATAPLLAELMIGRELDESGAEGRYDYDAPSILSVMDLHVHMPGEEVHGVDLEIRKGEVFGIGGLAGQGKLGIAAGIMGLYTSTGEVVFDGHQVPLNDPAAALEHGLAFVSEDRRGVGLLLDQSIQDNIGIPAMHMKGRFLKGLGPLAVEDTASLRSHVQSEIASLDIRCRGPKQPVRRLSGGNQQKVCLSKAFTLDPKLLFVSEPTRGVDVGAKDRVLRLLVQRNREEGLTTIVTSSELAELRRVCDRIAIIDKGRVAGVLRPDAPDVEFGLLMGGAR